MENNERDLFYWISKMMLTELLQAGLLSEAEYRQLRKKLQRQYKPLIGGLDGETLKKEDHND